MGPAMLIGGAVAAAMFALGARLERGPRTPGRREVRRRRALPWVVGTMAFVGGVLLTIPVGSAVVALGLLVYSGLAAALTWRMVTLDRASAWLAPSRRRARLAVSVIGLTWLGVILGLLLWIADLLVGLLAAGA